MAEEVSECHSESWEELNSEEGTSACTAKKYIASKVCLLMIFLSQGGIYYYIYINIIYIIYIFLVSWRVRHE